MPAGARVLFAAVLAVAAYFCAGYGDFYAAVVLDLFFQFFVEFGLEFADFSAFQAGYVDVVAGAMAFVEMLVAAQVQKIELVDEAVTLEKVESAVNRDAVNAGVDFLRALEDSAGVEVAFGVVHDFEQDFSLAREAYAALFKGSLEAAGALVSVDAFAGGDSMGCCGGHGRFTVAGITVGSILYDPLSAGSNIVGSAFRAFVSVSGAQEPPPSQKP
jgi:hypothetical protein